MTKTEDIAKLDRAIKDAEIRIKTVLVHAESFSKEIDLLVAKQLELEENVKCLKKNRIIAIAQEFKRSKAELEKVRARIIILNNDKSHFLKTAEDMKQFIDKTVKELEKLKNINDNNVLQFNRGEKSDG